MFQKDLEFGKTYERIAVNLLKDEYLLTHPDMYCKGYDFITNKNEYEVKADRLAHKTGNLYIEYECSNKPSGISTTTANVWIYFVVLKDGHRVYKIPTDFIKSLLTPTTRSIRGGDNYNSKGYLLSESLFTEYQI
jgi:hypothetical protein